MAKKKFDLEAYKQTLELTPLEEKPSKYVELNSELQACLGLPGLPLGDISEIYGDSDTGKSTILLHAAAQAQAQGIFPVLIITEKKYREDRAQSLGFDKEAALVNRRCKSVEDVFEFVDKVIADVNRGKLPYDTMIFVDSLGSINCRAARIDNKDGTTTIKNVHQQNAKAITEALMVVSDKINDTRYTESNHYIGLAILNQIYVQPASFPGGKPSNKPRGGKKLKYVSSLQMETKKIKELSAKVDGALKSFGIITKLVVKKNHINSIKNTGEFVITADEIFANEPGAITDYKNRNKEKWGNALIEEHEHENDN